MREWQAKNRERVREANRRSYQLHVDERLAQRRSRREVEGDAIRKRERERYAKKKGRPVRPYPRRR